MWKMPVSHCLGLSTDHHTVRNMLFTNSENSVASNKWILSSHLHTNIRPNGCIHLLLDNQQSKWYCRETIISFSALLSVEKKKCCTLVSPVQVPEHTCGSLARFDMRDSDGTAKHSPPLKRATGLEGEPNCGACPFKAEGWSAVAGESCSAVGKHLKRCSQKADCRPRLIRQPDAFLPSSHACWMGVIQLIKLCLFPFFFLTR